MRIERLFCGSINESGLNFILCSATISRRTAKPVGLRSGATSSRLDARRSRSGGPVLCHQVSLLRFTRFDFVRLQPLPLAKFLDNQCPSLRIQSLLTGGEGRIFLPFQSREFVFQGDAFRAALNSCCFSAGKDCQRLRLRNKLIPRKRSFTILRISSPR